MEALGLNLGYLLVQIFNFAIIFVVLRAWVYKPVLELLEKRREKIAKGLEDARVASEARENAEEEAKSIIAKAQAEANKRISEAAEKAEVAANEVLAKAEEETITIREEAQADAELNRDRILADVRGQVATLAMAAAQKLIGEALDEKRQRNLIKEFFSGLTDGEVVVLEDTKLEKSASAEVTSALPLTTDEQEKVKKDIISKIGSQASVVFRVDPSILGGLVVRAGDKVLDGSVAGQLEGMSQRLR